jgi:transposase InsO family protein
VAGDSKALFALLKVERLHGARFATVEQATAAVIAWLQWYNQARMHSTPNYGSPMKFEQDLGRCRNEDRGV